MANTDKIRKRHSREGEQHEKEPRDMENVYGLAEFGGGNMGNGVRNNTEVFNRGLVAMGCVCHGKKNSICKYMANIYLIFIWS